MQDNLQQLSFGNTVSLHFFHRVWNWISTSLFNLDSVNSAGSGYCYEKIIWVVGIWAEIVSNDRNQCIKNSFHQMHCSEWSLWIRTRPNWNRRHGSLDGMGGMGVWSGLFLPPLSIGCDFWVGQAKAKKELKGTLWEATNKKTRKFGKIYPNVGGWGRLQNFINHCFYGIFYSLFCRKFPVNSW